MELSTDLNPPRRHDLFGSPRRALLISSVFIFFSPALFLFSTPPSPSILFVVVFRSISSLRTEYISAYIPFHFCYISSVAIIMVGLGPKRHPSRKGKLYIARVLGALRLGIPAIPAHLPDIWLFQQAKMPFAITRINGRSAQGLPVANQRVRGCVHG